MNSSAPARRATATTWARCIAGIGEGDVVVDGAVEQDVLLQHDADLPAQPGGIELRQVGAVEQDLALVRHVEPLDQLGQRRLAGPEGPTMPITSPGLDREGHALEDVGRARPVAERDVAEARSRRGGQVDWPARHQLGRGV